MRRSLRIRGTGRLLLLVAVGALSHGCLYGFAGGGLPGHIRTAAILPFDNQTPEPVLTQEVTAAVRQAIEDRLGLRVATEADADAVVRGAILRYEPEIPLSFQTAERGAAAQVTRRRVQITIRVEIYDQVEGRMLWERGSLTVDGEYDPPQEDAGRGRALEKLVADIVDGAQSQW